MAEKAFDRSEIGVRIRRSSYFSQKNVANKKSEENLDKASALHFI